MTIKKHVEEIDNTGNRKVTTIEESPAVSAEERDVRVERSGEVVHSSRGAAEFVRDSMRSLAMLIGVVAFGLLALLSFRFAFLLGGANPSNGFVEFIYDSTGWLVDPFDGIASQSDSGDGVFDPATLIAMAVVITVTVLVMLTLRAITSVPSASVERTPTRHSQRETHNAHETDEA